MKTFPGDIESFQEGDITELNLSCFLLKMSHSILNLQY